MRSNRRGSVNVRLGFAVAALAIGLCVAPASAATKYWDGGGANVNWDTAANWDGPDILPANDSSAAGDGATFNQGSYTRQPTMNVAWGIRGLSFGSSSAAVTIAAGNTLTIGDSGVTIDAGVSVNHAINCSTLIGTSQTWANNGAASLNVGGAITISNPLSLTGSGTVNLTGGNSGAGGVKLGGPTVSINAATRLGSGLITLSAGRLYINNFTTAIANNITVDGDSTFEWYRTSNNQTFPLTGTVTFAPGLTTFTVARSGGTQSGNHITFTGLLNLDTDFAFSGDHTAGAGNTLQFIAGGNNVTWSANRAVALNNIGGMTWNGNLVGGANTLTFTGSNSSTITFGTFNGTSGGLKVNLPSTVFNGTGSFSGGVVLQGGTLSPGSSSTGGAGSVATGPIGTGVLTVSGGKVRITVTGLTLSNDILINGDSTLEYQSTANGNKTLDGTISFNSGLNTFTISQLYASDNNQGLYGNLNLNADFVVAGNIAGSNKTFTFGASGKNISFSANRTVTFSNTFTGTGSNIIRGSLAGGANTLTLAGTAPITFGDTTVLVGGSCGGVVVAGPTVSFNGANSFGGGVKIVSGTASSGNNAGFGTGSLTLAGGTLKTSAARTLTNPLSVTGAATVDTASGNLVLNANSAFQAPAAGGALLTKINANTLTFSSTYTMGVRLNAGAELFSASAFTLVNSTGGTTTRSSTWEDAEMWSAPAGSGTLTSSLQAGASKGTISGGAGSASFVASDLGYVQIDGLETGEPYATALDFGGVTPPLAAIKAALAAAHPTWTAFADDGVSKVTFAATAAAGTSYLGWDNRYSALGANVKGVAVQPALPAIANVAVTSKGADFIDFPYNLSSTGAAPTRVSLYYGTSPHDQTGWENTNHLAGSQSTGADSVHIGGLGSGATYYYQFRASNDYGIVWATNIPMSAATSAGIVNSPVSGRTYTGATLKGALGDTGGATVDVIVHWGTNNLGETTNGWDGSYTFSNQTAVGEVPLAHDIATDPDKVYYYKFRMTNTTESTGSWAPGYQSFDTYAAHVAASGSPSEDGTTGTFTISRVAAAATESWTVDFALTGGATEGSDYVTVSPHSVTLGVSETSKTVTIRPIYDGVADDGTVEIELTGADPSTALLEPGQKTLTIADYLVPITVVATDANAAEASTDDGTVQVRRPPLGTNAAVTVNFTMSGDAIEGSDYSLSTAGHSVILGIGQTNVNITLDALPDLVSPEPNEDATLTLAAGLYAIGSPSSATVTITNRVPVTWYDKANGNFTSSSTWTNGAGGSGYPVGGDIGVIDSQVVTMTAGVDPTASLILAGGTLRNDTANLTHNNPITVNGNAAVMFGTPTSSNIRWDLAGDISFLPGCATFTVDSPRTGDRDADVNFIGNVGLHTDFTLTSAGTWGGNGNGANDLRIGASGKNLTFATNRKVTIDTTMGNFTTAIGQTYLQGTLVGGGTLTLDGAGNYVTLGTLAGNCSGVVIDLPSAVVNTSVGSTFAGGVTLQSGTLRPAGSSTGSPGAVSAGPVGIGSLALSGGKLQWNTGGTLSLDNTVLINGDAIIENNQNGNARPMNLLGDVTLAAGLTTLTVNTVGNQSANHVNLSGNVAVNTDFATAGTLTSDNSLAFGGSGKNITFGANRQIVFGNTFGTGGNVIRGVLAGGGNTLTLAGAAPVTFGDGTAAISGTCGGVVFNGPTVTLAAANGYSGGTTVSAGWVRVGNNAGFSSGAIALSAGKISSDGGSARSMSNTLTVGGDCTLGDSVSTGTLTFTGNKTVDGALTLTVPSAVTFSTGSLTLYVGDLLTKAGAATLTTSGSLLPILRNGIGVFGSGTVPLISASAGSLSDTTTLGATAGGLWASKTSNASSVNVVLGKLKATMAAGDSARFAEDDSGHVAITDMTPGQAYAYVLFLGTLNPGVTTEDVAARMAANPAFSEVKVEGPKMIAFHFTAPASGTAYLAWDNVGDGDLGASVRGLGQPLGMRILLR